MFEILSWILHTILINDLISLVKIVGWLEKYLQQPNVFGM
jgi:hypothetical protein